MPDVGHRVIAGWQSGVGRDDASESVRVLGDEAQADQATPVLPDERDAAQIQDVLDEVPGPLDLPGVGVVLLPGRLVRAPEADKVGRDRAQSGVREDRQHRPVQERPGRFAVQQQHRLTVGWPRLDPRHLQRAAVLVGHQRVLRLVVEAGQRGEAVVRGPERVHPANNKVARPPVCERIPDGRATISCQLAYAKYASSPLPHVPAGKHACSRMSVQYATVWVVPGRTLMLL